MDASEINDVREEPHFRGVSFSNFKKTDVRKELLNSLIDSKIEPACYWSAELVCAGHFLELWDIILCFIGKYVHLANPRLPIYVEMRYDRFKTIIQNGYGGGNEFRLRNNPMIRKLFAEMMCVLCNTKKQHKYDSVKIKKSEEYDITIMTQKLKAPRITYVEGIFRSGDPKEIFIALNEFAYHISSESKNSLLACYWIEWIIEFDVICKQRKEVCRCERRSHINVDDKLQFDPIWIVWDIIVAEASNAENHDTLTTKIVTSLFNLYCMRFTSGVRKRRRYIMYFAISLLNDAYNPRCEIIENKQLVESVVTKINAIYKQIKKNEITPSTDYLFNGIERSDLDKTFEKIEMLNAMNTIIRKDGGEGE